MHDHIAIINDDPAAMQFALFAAFLLVLRAHIVQRGVGQRVQHAVAGAGAQHEVVGKGGDVFNIENQNIFAFGIFKRVDNGMCQVKCVQKSPRKLFCVMRRRGRQLERF